MKKTKYAYMCKVDYDYHIGEDYNPVKNAQETYVLLISILSTCSI